MDQMSNGHLGQDQMSCKQVIEVVKPPGHPFPDPLEEGIAFGIYSAFIEPPPTVDTEMKGLNPEQGPEESQPKAGISETDPLVGFTIEDVKSALGQVTDDVLIGLQLCFRKTQISNAKEPAVLKQPSHQCDRKFPVSAEMWIEIGKGIGAKNRMPRGEETVMIWKKMVEKKKSEMHRRIWASL
ncbi:hypothetical protein CB1_000936004 [Camelus ferus]|nr:hypothetical protein CB1_000936004 [Camelus ferus]